MSPAGRTADVGRAGVELLIPLPSSPWQLTGSRCSGAMPVAVMWKKAHVGVPQLGWPTADRPYELDVIGRPAVGRGRLGRRSTAPQPMLLQARTWTVYVGVVGCEPGRTSCDVPRTSSTPPPGCELDARSGSIGLPLSFGADHVAVDLVVAAADARARRPGSAGPGVLADAVLPPAPGADVVHGPQLERVGRAVGEPGARVRRAGADVRPAAAVDRQLVRGDRRCRCRTAGFHVERRPASVVGRGAGDLRGARQAGRHDGVGRGAAGAVADLVAGDDGERVASCRC